MRVHLAVVGRETWHLDQLQKFAHYAAASTSHAHQHVEDPSASDVVLFVDLHLHPDDRYLTQLRHHPLVKRWPEKIRVYDERDQPFFTFPGLYVGTKERQARRRLMTGAPYTSDSTDISRGDVGLRPELLFSFAGSRTYPLRDRVLALRHDRGVLEDTSHLNFFDWNAPVSAEIVQARRSYAEVMSNSKFVLCPRGQGPSSFRLYQSLSLGRVPVIISDQWVAPVGPPWPDVSIRVPEVRVADIPALLEGAEASWPRMAKAAANVYAENFAEGTIWHYFIDQLDRLPLPASAPSKRPWWLQDQVARIAFRHVRSGVHRRRASLGTKPN